MAKKKEQPFATISIDLYENSRVVNITGFKRISERVLGDLEPFIRAELYLLRAAAARAQKATEREQKATAEAESEEVPTEDMEPLALPSSVA